MFCVLIYDISIQDKEDEKRLNKVFNICKKYLEHIEFSVFYGDINKRKLKELIKEIKETIDLNRDSVIFYLFKSREDIRSIIKYGINEETNII